MLHIFVMKLNLILPLKIEKIAEEWRNYVFGMLIRSMNCKSDTWDFVPVNR